MSKLRPKVNLDKDMINVDFFSGNRRRLVQNVAGADVIVLAAHTNMQLVGDAAAPFRQESNFWYLTGIEEPDWLIIMVGDKSWLACPSVSSTRKIFDGSLDISEAKSMSGVDEVIDITRADSLIDKLSSQHRSVGLLGTDPNENYYDFVLNPASKRLHDRLAAKFNHVVDIRPELKRLRAIKQPAEIDAITRAVNLTAQTFELAKLSVDSLSHEYELEAIFTGEFRRHNAHHAYDPIVAGGKNACTLHYVKNTQELKNGSLVLLDIGARLDGYTADITRTYAVGQQTDRQISIHNELASAHSNIVELIKPGASIREYHEQVDKIMQKAIKSLGLMSKPSDYRVYFPHAIGHGLGIDVHDSLAGFESFEPGMVLTVEPGIYIPEESIGVRLEDDILVTDTGSQNLSGNLSLEM